MTLEQIAEEFKLSFWQKAKKKIVAYTLPVFLSGIGALGCGSDEQYISHQKKTTSPAGEVNFGEYQVKVKSEQNKSLAKITVHYLSDGESGLFLAVDPKNAYYPEDKPLPSSSQSSLEVNSLQQPLSRLDLIMKAYQVGKEALEIASTDQRKLLGKDKNFNKYCLTLDQMKHSYIDIPAGLVLLAAKSSGYPTKEIHLAVTKPLKHVFERYILNHFGEQKGYEVWVPKTAMSICGEDYTNAVCNISDNRLSKIWDSDLPIWHIKGGCQPGSTSTNPCAPIPGLVFCDDFNGKGLDFNKWKGKCDPFNYKLNNGALEIRSGGNNIVNGCNLVSHSTYLINKKTFSFETKLKTNTHREVNVIAGLDSDEGTISLSYDGIRSIKEGCADYLEIDVDWTKYQTAKFEGDNNNINFYVDNLKKTLQCVPDRVPLQIELTCISYDSKEKTCFFDYVKLIIK